VAPPLPSADLSDCVLARVEQPMRGRDIPQSHVTLLVSADERRSRPPIQYDECCHRFVVLMMHCRQQLALNDHSHRYINNINNIGSVY